MSLIFVLQQAQNKISSHVLLSLAVCHECDLLLSDQVMSLKHSWKQSSHITFVCNSGEKNSGQFQTRVDYPWFVTTLTKSLSSEQKEVYFRFKKIFNIRYFIHSRLSVT
jgi:hypothetical protein